MARSGVDCRCIARVKGHNVGQMAARDPHESGHAISLLEWVPQVLLYLLQLNNEFKSLHNALRARAGIFLFPKILNGFFAVSFSNKTKRKKMLINIYDRSML